MSTNVAVAIAALAIVWRVVFSPASLPEPSARSRDPIPVEDVSNKNLSVEFGDSARMGSPSAKVVLVEFSDYECPFCGRFASTTLDEINRTFLADNKVQYVFRNLPLEIHKQAIFAAQAAECSGAQGKYWEMHERLFAKQTELAADLWNREAVTLGLDLESFTKCLEGEMLPRVKQDMAEAARLQVQSTPTFFVGRLNEDGGVTLVRRINGAQPFTIFEDALSEALKE